MAIRRSRLPSRRAHRERSDHGDQRARVSRPAASTASRRCWARTRTAPRSCAMWLSGNWRGVSRSSGWRRRSGGCNGADRAASAVGQRGRKNCDDVGRYTAMAQPRANPAMTNHTATATTVSTIRRSTMGLPNTRGGPRASRASSSCRSGARRASGALIRAAQARNAFAASIISAPQAGCRDANPSVALLSAWRSRMGQGYGWLQSRLLDLLREHEPQARRGSALDTPALAQRVYGRTPTRSELVSIRRALMTLLQSGMVSRHSGRHKHRHWWYIRSRGR
jgi:hypothetical protein